MVFEGCQASLRLGFILRHHGVLNHDCPTEINFYVDVHADIAAVELMAGIPAYALAPYET